ncbi:MAG TPA: hypothetical protein VKT72_13730 [Candidatus Baltobacteraceae bacterium]|nr:hypothetical protein [Candidatus Baltobacteraceae bacterium]
MQSSEDLGNTFGRSWQLLSSNWNIIIPAIVLGIIGGVLQHIIGAMFINGGAAVGSFGAVILGGFLLLAIATIIQILTIGFTTGMGIAAWRTGRTNISDGSAVFANAGAVQTIVLWMVIGVILALIPVLGWLADIVLFFLLIYAVPAAVVSGEGAGAAFGESVNIITRNFIPTLIIVLLIFCIGFVGAIVGTAISFVPYLGKIVAMIIQESIIAYGTLVICGEYLKVRTAVGVPPSATPPG